MKCEIPSFVADFVTVNSWIDNTGSEYFAEIDLNYGNVVVKDYLITMHKPKILKKTDHYTSISLDRLSPAH